MIFDDLFSGFWEVIFELWVHYNRKFFRTAVAPYLSQTGRRTIRHFSDIRADVANAESNCPITLQTWWGVGFALGGNFQSFPSSMNWTFLEQSRLRIVHQTLWERQNCPHQSCEVWHLRLPKATIVKNGTSWVGWWWRVVVDCVTVDGSISYFS